MTVRSTFFSAWKVPYHLSTPSILTAISAPAPADAESALRALSVIAGEWCRVGSLLLQYGGHRLLEPLLVDLVELAVGLDLVDELVDSRQQLLFARLDGDALHLARELELLVVFAGGQFLDRQIADVRAANERHLTGNQRLQGGGVRIEAADRGGFRRHLGHRRILRRRARDRDRLAREVFRLRDFNVVLAINANGDRGIRLGEVDALRALGRNAERRDEHVDLAAQQIRNAVRSGDRNQLQ